MRVIQLIDTLRSGGAERMAVNMAHVFSEHGIANSLIVSREGGIQTDRLPASLPLTILRKKSFYDLSAFRRLVRETRKFKPDVIHAHSTSIFWAVFLKFFTKKTLLIWHDHYGLSDQLSSGDRKLEKILSKWIDGVVVVNQKLKTWILKETSLTTREVVMIPNFPYLNKKYTQKRVAKIPIVLLQIANFRRQKNHLLSLKVLKWLNENGNKEVELWFAGANTLEPDYSSEVKRFILSEGLENCVKLLGDSEDIEELLQQASIGILTSDSEGLPVSLLEYGLAALPVVVTEVGECNLVLRNGTFGKITPPGEVEAFAKAVKWTIDHYSESAEIGVGFQSNVKISYGGNGFFSKYQAFLKSLS